MSDSGLTRHSGIRVNMPSAKRQKRGLIFPSNRRWDSEEWKSYCNRTTKAERKLRVA